MAAKASDFLEMSKRDMKSCLYFEKIFPDEFAVGNAMYFVQQAIEKQLKTISLFCGEEPPYTHDIRKLMARCSKYVEMPENLDLVADTLTLWESKTRYDPYIVFSKKQYTISKEVYQELSEIINTNFASKIQDDEELLDLTNPQKISR